MRRIYTGIILLALALTFVAPLTSSAAAPSATNMLKEQVSAQTMIRALTGNVGSSGQLIDWIWFGKFTKTSTKAVIPIYVHLHGGTTVVGTLDVRKYAGNWYFYSITRGTHAAGISNVAIPAGITSSVMKTSITEQKAHQWMLLGIVTGGYKKLTVTSRSGNFGTRQVNVKLSRGTRHTAIGRMLAYRKTATSGNMYWFLSAIKK